MHKWEDIVLALEDPKYIWRTVRGVSKQLNASQHEIENFLADHASEIIKSSIPAESGEERYTTRRHYRRMVSPFDKIASSLTQTVTSSSSSSSSDRE